jgi:hypothetical protein
MNNLEKFYCFTWIPKIFFIIFWLLTSHPGWLVGWGITTLAGISALVLDYINIKNKGKNV